MSKLYSLIALTFAISLNFYSLAQPQLWGTTNNGRSILAGTIFNLDTAGNNYQLQYDWSNLNDGKKTGAHQKLWGVVYICKKLTSRNSL